VSRFIDVSHVIEDGQITYPAFLSPNTSAACTRYPSGASAFMPYRRSFAVSEPSRCGRTRSSASP